jgi:2-succinyl-5-enolpyruvyl-6-hydroxy-3-cyclohexene-1-carboxylate synthase
VRAPGAASADAGALELAWTERGVVVCGDGDYDAAALVELAERAGWPLLAEPSSGARSGPNALSAYQYLLADLDFMALHRPDVIVSAGRPGLSRAQTALLSGAAGNPIGKAAGAAGRAAGDAGAVGDMGVGDAGDAGATGRAAGVAGAVRQVVIAQGPGRWADQQRVATDVVSAIRLTGTGTGGRQPAGQGRARSGGDWLRDWTTADGAARRAVDAVLDAEDGVTEPRIARDLAAALPEGALLWAGSSMPIRDLDSHMPPRDDIRVLASRGASGIDGTTSSAIGAALAHRGPAYAIIGDLAFLHDVSGLALGPREPRPDLCLVVVNNDGGGIFSTLEQAAFDGFERLFGTPHGAALHHLAAAFGVPYQLLEHPDDLAKAVQGSGLRIIEARTTRSAAADLRARLRATATQSIASDQHTPAKK